MRRRSINNLNWGVIIVLVFATVFALHYFYIVRLNDWIAFGGSVFSGSIPGVSPVETVYVPKVGTVWCEDLGWKSSPVKQEVKGAGLALQRSFAPWESMPSPEDSAASQYRLSKVYSCRQAQCKVNLQTIGVGCGSGFYAYVAATKEVGGGSSVYFKKSYYPGGAPLGVEEVIPSDLVVDLSENEVLTVYAICHRLDLIPGRAIHQPDYLQFFVTERRKALVAYTPDVSRFEIPSSDDCLRQDLVSAKNKLNTVRTDIVINPLAVMGMSFGKVVGDSKTTDELPNKLSIGRSYVFAYGLRPELGASLDTTESGVLAYGIPGGTFLWKVNTVNIDGREYKIAGELLTEKAQCVVDDDCRNLGNDYSCKHFKCVHELPSCSPWKPCPTDRFERKSNGRFDRVYYTCENGVCRVHRVEVGCSLVGEDGCEADEFCNRETFECEKLPITWQECPAECCIPAAKQGKIKPKPCPEGKYCKTNSGVTGVCVVGDKENEDKQWCDPPLIMNENGVCVCPAGTHLVRGTSFSSGFFGLGSGTTATVSCEPDTPWGLLGSIAIGVVVIFVVLYIARRKRWI